MQMPKPSPAFEAKFPSLVPDDPRVEHKKMFGQLAAFADGNMFMGLFGDGLMMRLGDEDRAKFLKLDGACLFEPMPGKPMREYVSVPPALLADGKKLAPWAKRSLDYATSLPAKKAKAPAKKAAAATKKAPPATTEAPPATTEAPAKKAAAATTKAPANKK